MAVNARRASRVVFQITYSSSYTILFLLLLITLAVTPGDHIYQTVSNGKYGNVFVVGGTYVVTALIAIFIYFSRLYTNRTTLATIPKPYLPIQDGEVSKKIRKMIVENRQRSALIASESRPRPLERELDEKGEIDGQKDEIEASERAGKPKGTFIPVSADSPPWGEIQHPGWSSPSTLDLPDVHFDTVVAELPNLIEAKAVSLAPPDPTFKFLDPVQDTVHPPPNPEVVAKLQRQKYMGLRDYVNYLVTMGVVARSDIVVSFVSQYEYARFSTYALTEEEFRKLMAAFSEVLVSMTSPSLDRTDRPSSSSQASKMSDKSAASQSSVMTNFHTRSKASSVSSSIPSTGSVVRHATVDDDVA